MSCILLYRETPPPLPINCCCIGWWEVSVKQAWLPWPFITALAEWQLDAASFQLTVHASGGSRLAGPLQCMTHITQCTPVNKTRTYSLYMHVFTCLCSTLAKLHLLQHYSYCSQERQSKSYQPIHWKWNEGKQWVVFCYNVDNFELQWTHCLIQHVTLFFLMTLRSVVDKSLTAGQNKGLASS